MVSITPRHGILVYIIWWFLYDDEMSWGCGDGYVVLWAPMDRPIILYDFHDIKSICIMF